MCLYCKRRGLGAKWVHIAELFFYRDNPFQYSSILPDWNGMSMCVDYLGVCKVLARVSVRITEGTEDTEDTERSYVLLGLFPWSSI